MKLNLISRRCNFETDDYGERIGKSATYIYEYVACPNCVVSVRFYFHRLYKGLMNREVEIEIEDPYLFHFRMDYDACIPFDHFDPNSDILVDWGAKGRKIYLSEIVERFEKAHLAIFGHYGDEIE